MRKRRRRTSGFKQKGNTSDHPFREHIRPQEGEIMADKSYAKLRVREAIRRGEVVRPRLCVKCNAEPAQVFHINGYSDPMDFVFWGSRCQTEYLQMRDAMRKEGIDPSMDLTAIVKELLKEQAKREGVRRELVANGEMTETQAEQDRQRWAVIITQARASAASEMGLTVPEFTSTDIKNLLCSRCGEPEAPVESEVGGRLCIPCAMAISQGA